MISEGLVMFCNGDRGRCTNRIESSHMHALALQLYAQQCGWHAPEVQGLHYCPTCAERAVPGHGDVGLDILHGRHEDGGPPVTYEEARALLDRSLDNVPPAYVVQEQRS